MGPGFYVIAILGCADGFVGMHAGGDDADPL